MSQNLLHEKFELYCKTCKTNLLESLSSSDSILVDVADRTFMFDLSEMVCRCSVTWNVDPRDWVMEVVN